MRNIQMFIHISYQILKFHQNSKVVFRWLQLFNKNNNFQLDFLKRELRYMLATEISVTSHNHMTQQIREIRIHIT